MASAIPKLTEVLATVHRSGRVLELRMNTPQNLNCFTPTKYREIIEGLRYARDTKDIHAVVLTGEGRIFSSGAAVDGEHRLAHNSDALRAAEEYIDALIDFPKLLATGIHGPAFGVATTTLPFFDLVYASPEASFTTPFSRIGASIEGCSSVTFPPLFGPSMTSRLLCLSQTIPAKDLAYSGLFAEILPAEGLQEAVVDKVAKALEGLAPGSITTSKSVLRPKSVRDMLHATNAAEIQVFNQRLGEQEHRDFLAAFLDGQKKKRKPKA